MLSNEEINDIIKIVKSLKESGLLIKGVSEIINNEAKEQKGGFLGMLLRTLAASLLGSALAGKGTLQKMKFSVKDFFIFCAVVVRGGDRVIQESQETNGFLMLLHPLTHFEIQQYYQNKPKFNDVYSRNNLPKIKDGAYVINLYAYKSVGTH